MTIIISLFSDFKLFNNRVRNNLISHLNKKEMEAFLFIR